MKRWKVTLLLLVPTAFVFCAALTGGVVVNRVNDFGGQEDICLAQGLQADLWLAPKLRGFGIPFVFYYRRAGTPFSLRLQIWDESKLFHAIEVNEIVVEYVKNGVPRKIGPWCRKLSPYTVYQSSSSGLTQREMLVLNDRVSDLVISHEDVKITLTGTLLRKDGHALTFTVSETFQARSQCQLLTYWQEAAGC